MAERGADYTLSLLKNSQRKISGSPPARRSPLSMPSHMTEKSLDRAGKPEKRKKKRPPEAISADANPPPTKKKKKKEAGDPTKIQEPKEKKRKKLDAVVISGADKPRAKKRAVKEEPAAAVASASSADEEAPADGGARVACTLFVGQLPYKATAKDVEASLPAAPATTAPATAPALA